MEYNLIEELKKHKPFDELEKQHTEKTISFLKKHGDKAFERSFEEGHITASGYLFNSDYSELLMTHHKQFDEWYQLGGHSDGDTNSLRVAKREVWEESGIKEIEPVLKGIGDIDIQFIDEYKPHNMPGHYHYDIRYFFKTDVKDYVVSDESYDLKWMPFEEFVKMAKIPEAKRVVEKWKLLRENNKK